MISGPANLPGATSDAIDSLRPRGSAYAAGAQVVLIGAAPRPKGFRSVRVTARDPFSLADQICACQPDDASKSNCTLQAKNAESTFSIGSADEKFCQQKLDLQQCDCGSQSSQAATAACCVKLNTPEGRAACGLVISSP